MTDHLILHADALDVPSDLIAQCDVQIVDSPYGEHVHANAVSTRTGGAGVRERDLGFEALTPVLRSYIAAATCRVKRWSVIFSDHEGTHLWREACDMYEAEYIRTVPWVRWSQPQISGDRPPTGSEAVLCFHSLGPNGKPVRKRWNGSGGLTHFGQKCLRGEHKHPTEKPLDLMLAIVSAFSDPGETVLDLCGGSGTTAVACDLLGRQCVCVERDAQWAEFAERRVTGPLSPRDATRALDWADDTADEAEATGLPYEKDGREIGRPAWERGQRRLADTARVIARLRPEGNEA